MEWLDIGASPGTTDDDHHQTAPDDKRRTDHVENSGRPAETSPPSASDDRWKGEARTKATLTHGGHEDTDTDTRTRGHGGH